MANTVYSGACTTQTGTVQYYSVVGGPITRYSGLYSIPSISEIYPGCTAGTTYKIYPSASMTGFPTSFTSSSMYKSHFGVLYSCTSCADGYELVDNTAPYEYRYNSETVSCTSLTDVSVLKVCKKSGDSGGGTTTPTCTPSNCAPGAWTTYNTAYVRRTYRWCSSSTICSESVQYACNVGYYGNAGSSTATGCVACPPFFAGGTTYETTSNAVAQTSTDACFIKAVGNTTEFDDGTGTFVFYPYDQPTHYCYYKLGKCADYTWACATTSGTVYSVVNGTKTHNSSGQYCWCNANGKSFFATNLSSASTCATSCINVCQNAMTGFSGNAYTAMVSLDSLGCF